jgi:hypothetical protein
MFWRNTQSSVEMLSPELPTATEATRTRRASDRFRRKSLFVAPGIDARPFKLPTEVAQRVMRIMSKSQWSQNLFTTRDEDNVVEQTSLALLPGELSSNGDDRWRSRRQREQLTPKVKKL